MKKLLLTSLLSLSAAGFANAANIDWNGTTSSNWSTATNWSSAPTDGGNDVLRFGTVAPTTRNVNVDVTNFDVQNFNITDNGTWNFSGNTLNWGDFGGTSAPRVFLGAAASGTTTFNNNFNVADGVGGLLLDMRSTGGGTLDINGNITGNTDGVTAFWTAAASGATIRLDGSNNTFTGGLNVNFSGGTTSGGTFILGGSVVGNNVTITTDAGNTGTNTFQLASTGTLGFTIGANGVNNAISSVKVGSEVHTLLLDGTFQFDLTGAGTIVGNSWSILDPSAFAETYSGTFAIASTFGSFTEVANVWTINENGVDYQFSELTGILTVVPEPGTYALLAGALSLLCVMIRRRS